MGRDVEGRGRRLMGGTTLILGGMTDYSSHENFNNESCVVAEIRMRHL